MYGFARCSPYAVYVTDMVRLWHECPTEEAVSKKAVLMGVSDFDSHKLALFVSQLEDLFVSSNRLRFSSPSDTAVDVAAPLSNELTWEFHLQRVGPEATAVFFGNQLTHSLLNHSFLLYKIAKLEETIRAKDTYTLYLEENYRTVNGAELIDKYKRQHPHESEALSKYSRESTETAVCSAYKNLTLKNYARAGNENLLIWDYISTAVADTLTWSSSIVKSGTRATEDVNTPSLKREFEEPSLSVAPLKKVKLEPTEDKVKQKQISPRRKRIGMIRRP